MRVGAGFLLLLRSIAFSVAMVGVAGWQDPRAVILEPIADPQVTGTATWYATGPGRGDAAAGGELRTGDWRGRRVQVTAGGRTVVVTLSDWCACAGNRIIDLSDEDFADLAPLSVGVIRVTVTQLGASATPPATHAIPQWSGTRPGRLVL